MKFRAAAVIAPALAGALLLSTPLPAQQQPVPALSRPVTLTLREAPLADALRTIAAQAGFRLSYGGAVPERRVTLSLRGVPAEEALRRALAGSGLGFRTAGGQVVLVPAPASTPAAAAQEAERIAGVVRGGRDAEPVAGARVQVEGTERSAVTDVTGRYAIAGVPAGTRAVAVSRLGFQPKRVTGVAVAAGRTAEVDVALDAGTLEIAGVTVTAQRERSTTRALLLERKQAPAVVDVVGREQIDRSTDADAAEVVQRVPGAELREGRYPVVRGMGDRYGEVTLNGVSLPSTDPNRKAVALDVLPSQLLESVVVSKGFTPDQPGDYVGGLVQLRTRSVPTGRAFRVSSGVGYNTESSLRRGPAFPGCSNGWTGFSSCWSFPSSLDDGRSIDGVNLEADPPVETERDAEEEERLAEDLAASMPWAPVERDIPLNRSLSLTYGDAFGPLGFVAAGSWNNAYNRRGGYRDAVVRVLDDAPSYRSDYVVDEGTHDVTVGGMLSASLLLGASHRLTGSALLNRQSEERGITREGYYWSQDIDVRVPENRYVRSTLWSAQLGGDHLFGAARLGWRAAYSGVGRYEPGSRRVIYTTRSTRSSAQTGYVGPVEGVPWEFFSDRFSGEVLHQDLDETSATFAADLSFPLGFWPREATFKLGGAVEDADRGVITRRIRFLPADGASRLPDEVGTLAPDELFTPENVGGVLRTQEASIDRDSYDARATVRAAYVMLDAELLPRLRLVTGVRVEDSRQEVDARRLFGLKLQDGESQGRVKATDLLPAAHLTWSPREDMNVRVGAARTLARPQFREIAPYNFQDYFGGYNTAGNPRLRRSLIDNADLRWEWFPGAGAVVSAGVFGKRFHLPIEPLVYGETSGTVNVRFINTRKATTYGGEVEVRAGLGTLVSALDGFSVNANYTFLRTEVDSIAFRLGSSVIRVPPERRTIFGQTPYLLNVGLSYDAPRVGTEVTLLFRRAGERLEIAPSNFFPAVYEVPRSDLDAVIQQPLGRGLSVKVSAERLLGSGVRFRQEFPNGETITPRRYDLGRTFSLSFTWDGTEGR